MNCLLKKVCYLKVLCSDLCEISVYVEQRLKVLTILVHVTSLWCFQPVCKPLACRFLAQMRLYSNFYAAIKPIKEEVSYVRQLKRF